MAGFRINVKALAVVGAVMTSLAAAAVADPQDGQPPDAAELVSAALRSELEGDDDARQELLLRARQSDPEHPAALWHSGAVQLDEAMWVDFRDAGAVDEKLTEEYRRLRARTPQTAAALLRLADWCGEQGLPDAERAHLMQVLRLDPDNAAARERRGDVNIDGMWISREDMARAVERQRAIAAGVERWGPRIEECLDLLGGVRRQRERGRQQLFAIRDLSAIPAMERLLAARSEAAGLLLIEWLSELDVYQSSQAMARTALRSPHYSVRLAAAEALQSRPYDEYMPLLLGALKTPVASESRTGITPGGWVVLDVLFDAEAQNERREMQLTTQVGRVRGGGSDVEEWRTARRFLINRQRQAERVRLQWNELIRETNVRANVVLRRVIDDRGLNEPEDWWNWWLRYNEIPIPAVKPSMRVQPEPERVYVEGERQRVLSEEAARAASGLCSCLAAGTPVWTERGVMPIERIQIGDRVLSQNVHSGELAYKPVLETTVRPPVRTFRVSADEMQFRANGGHPFWVNGQGWRFARDLQPGMRLHGIEGSVEIQSVEPADDAQVFNLVVADFHTYFLGRGRILSHDVAAREPTNALVPGLNREP